MAELKKDARKSVFFNILGYTIIIGLLGVIVLCVVLFYRAATWEERELKNWENNVLPNLPRIENEQEWEVAAMVACGKAAIKTYEDGVPDPDWVMPRCIDGCEAGAIGISGIGEGYRYHVFGYMDPNSGRPVLKIYFPQDHISFFCDLLYMGGDKLSPDSWKMLDSSFRLVYFEG